MPPKASRLPAPAILSKTADRHLTVYSTAAIAAGVSILALTQSARGEVVITRKTIPIPANAYPYVGIDLNHDGINDFSAYLNYSAYPLSEWNLFISPKPSAGGGGLVESRHNYPAAHVQGVKIGPSAHFGSSGRVEHVHSIDNTYSHHYGRTLQGNWGGNPRNRYLGVKFLINGQTHYGWIRLTVITEPRGLSATITEYAYETVANKTLKAGQTSEAAQHDAENADMLTGPAEGPSLGMLARGAEMMGVWRRKEEEDVA